MDDTRKRVLVVDDTPDNIWILAEALKGDYIVMTARSGKDALEIAGRAPKPDLILLDVLMPEMDGYEVCASLKDCNETRSIPIIFVTSQHDSGHEEKGLELGAVDYIGKPFIPSLVKARVRAQLELKAHRDELDGLVHDRTRELMLTQRFIINALARLAEWRDPETGEHIHRTRNYVRLLAQELRKQERFKDFFTDEVIEILHLVAPLHDMGKVCVPDAILLKPGALTPEEFEIMKQHTVCGRNVLDSAGDEIGNHDFLRIARDLVYSHHEKWDGSGYPERIAGEEIPLCGRIMALADVYDALSSRRVYKEAYSHERSRQMIAEGSGTHFCPVVVEAFMRCDSQFAAISGKMAD